MLNVVEVGGKGRVGVVVRRGAGGSATGMGWQLS